MGGQFGSAIHHAIPELQQRYDGYDVQRNGSANGMRNVIGFETRPRCNAFNWNTTATIVITKC